MALPPGPWAAASFQRTGDHFYQPVAQGSLESVWLLPLCTPVTNDMLPLQRPPRSLCSEYLTVVLQKGPFAACAR